MIFQLGILAAILTKLLLPYYLLGVLLRIFIPKPRPNYVALLSATCLMTIDYHLHIFGNIFDLQQGLDVAMSNAFKPEFEQIRVMLLVMGLVGTLLGTLLFPFALARGGVGTINKLRKTKMLNNH